MRRLAGVAAIIAAVVDAVYYGFVSHQDGHDPLGWRVPFVVTFIALLAITAALSTRASATTWRPALLGVSAIGLLARKLAGRPVKWIEDRRENHATPCIFAPSYSVFNSRDKGE